MELGRNCLAGRTEIQIAILGLFLLAAMGAQAQEAPGALPPGEISPAADFPEKSSALGRLRDLEAGLSRGDPLRPAEKAEVLRWAADHPSDSVRAQALALFSWLAVDEAQPPLLNATGDPAYRVRVQAVVGLDVLSRRLGHGERGQILAAAHRLLDDPATSVACAAARVVAHLAPRRAKREFSAKPIATDPVRAACFARAVGLDPPVAPVAEAARPQPEKKAQHGAPEKKTVPPTRNPVHSPALWTLAGALAGAGTAAALPALFEERRFFLDYSPSQTTSGRELGMPWAFAAASLGGALVGGAGGYALSLASAPDQAIPALMLVSGIPVGALGGFGLALAAGLDSQETGLPVAGGMALAAGAALASWPLGPGPGDVAFGLGVGTLALSGTALALFTAIPVSATTVYGTVNRVDLAMGAGLMAGALGTFSGFVLGPILDAPQQVVFGILAGGMAGMALGLLSVYTVVPIALETRPRIAAGAGLVGEIVGATLGGLVFPLLFPEGGGLPVQPGANGIVALGPQGISLGTPTIALGPTAHPEGVDLRISLVEGRF
jgi:hypothetical protein